MPVKPVLIFVILLVSFLTCPSTLFAGTVAGRVTYTGIPIRQKPIDMSKEPLCAKQHATPITGETVMTGPNGGLDNVVVYVSSGAPDDGQVPLQAITYTQKGCQYIPHVLPMHVNQELQIINGDDATHNIHPLTKVNAEWNKSQPPGAPPIKEKYGKPEFIPVKCNIHPWMHGWFVVLNTSHYDVSKGAGAFSLPNLPPGKYTITAWHEDYGTQNADITITGKETKTVNFTFKAKSY
jgi:Carboxypeptidase regulatory-like domain